MKKGTIVAIVVAIVLIIVGGILLAMGLSFAGSATPESTLTQQETMIQESFENIQIDTQDCDVTFVPYNGTADTQVLILERENVHHDVWVEDNTLKIKMVDERDWTDHIGVFGIIEENPEITLYLPLKAYKSVHVTTETGDMNLPQLMSEETLLRSDTGEIRCESAACETLDCMTDTGDILVTCVEVSEIRLTATTGSVTLTDGEAEDIYLKNTTGEIELESVVCRRLTCESETGDVELEWVQAEEYLQVFTTTGGVGIVDSDAGKVNIETDTGDVSGYFRTPKWFTANSNTGNVQVPEGRGGGECRIESNTGDICIR